MSVSGYEDIPLRCPVCPNCKWLATTVCAWTVMWHLDTDTLLTFYLHSEKEIERLNSISRTTHVRLCDNGPIRFKLSTDGIEDIFCEHCGFDGMSSSIHADLITYIEACLSGEIK